MTSDTSYYEINMRQVTFIWTPESDSSHRAFHSLHSTTCRPDPKLVRTYLWKEGLSAHGGTLSRVRAFKHKEPLLATVKRRKLAWFGHVTRRNSLSKKKNILQGTVEARRRLGRQNTCWMNNIKEWTSLSMPELLTRACCRKDWKRISAESSLMSPRRPSP